MTLCVCLQECADAGWWMGEIGGRQGVFPDNFVKILEVEKEVNSSRLLPCFKKKEKTRKKRRFPLTKKRRFVCLCVCRDQRNRRLPAPRQPSPPQVLFSLHRLPFTSPKHKRTHQQCEPSPVDRKPELKKVPPERPEHLPQRDQDRGISSKSSGPVPFSNACSSSIFPLLICSARCFINMHN